MARRRSDPEEHEEQEDSSSLFNPEQDEIFMGIQSLVEAPTKRGSKKAVETKVDSTSTRFKNLVKELKGITGEDAYKIQAEKLVYSTGSWALDLGLGRICPETGCGGLAQRTKVEVFGDTGSGKSNLLENVMAQIHKRDKNKWCAVIYSEEPDINRLKREGVDTNRVLFLDCYQPRHKEAKYSLAEERIDNLVECLRDPDCALGGFDSVKGLSGAGHVFEKGDMRRQKSRPMDQSDMAIRAQFMEKFFNRSIFNLNAIIAMVNQLSEGPDKDLRTGAGERPRTPAGRRMEFESQVRIKVSSSMIKGDEHELIERYKPAHAMKVYYDILKNRWSPEFNLRRVNTEYNFQKCEFNNAEIVLDYGTYIGIFERKGNWYKLGPGKDQTFNGHTAALNYLEAPGNYAFLFSIYLQLMARHNEIFQLRPGHVKKKAKSAFGRGDLDPEKAIAEDE